MVVSHSLRDEVNTFYLNIIQTHLLPVRVLTMTTGGVNSMLNVVHLTLVQAVRYYLPLHTNIMNSCCNILYWKNHDYNCDVNNIEIHCGTGQVRLLFRARHVTWVTENHVHMHVPVYMRAEQNCDHNL